MNQESCRQFFQKFSTIQEVLRSRKRSTAGSLTSASTPVEYSSAAGAKDPQTADSNPRGRIHGGAPVRETALAER